MPLESRRIYSGMFVGGVIRMINTEQHTFICGITGSGKTVFASWMYEHNDGLTIFYNTQLELRIERLSGAVVTDMSGLKKAYNKGHRKICYNPNEDEGIALSELVELIGLLFDMGKQVQKGVVDKPINWVRLFIDEIHEYSSKTSQNQTVDRAWKRGRRWGIIGIGISQRPAEVSHTILTQSPQHIIFYLGKYEKGYFDRYNIPVFKESEYSDWISRGWKKGDREEDRYYFLTYDQVSLEKYPPVEID